MTLETPPTPPAPAEPAVTRACPRCGAALTPDQEWCLSCGADVGARVAATPRWRVPVALVAVLVVAALAAVALALVELARDDQQTAQTPTTAAPTATAPAGEQPAPGEQGAAPGAQVPEAGDDQTAGGSGQSTPTPTQTPSPSPTTSGEGASGQPGTTSGESGTASGESPNGQSGAGATIADWPAGRTAWTVILESATSKSAADAKARNLSGQGVTVGVLHSDDFSSLRKGYWVVFSGQYDSRSAAESAMAGLTPKVPEAYVRHVVPS